MKHALTKVAHVGADLCVCPAEDDDNINHEDRIKINGNAFMQVAHVGADLCVCPADDDDYINNEDNVKIIYNITQCRADTQVRPYANKINMQATQESIKQSSIVHAPVGGCVCPFGSVGADLCICPAQKDVNCNNNSQKNHY